jgi:hypothetical protein
MLIKNGEFEKTMEEVTVKMQDFNIYDLFKGSGGDGGSSDISVILVQNLEKKVFKKFEFIDEKTKKQDEESYKNKNDIGNIKNNIENMNKQISQYIKDNDIVFNDFNLTIEDYKYKLDEIENKMQTIYKKIMDDIKNKEKAIKELENNNNQRNEQDNINEKNNDEKSKFSGNNFSELEVRMVKDCAKKIADLEKNFKILVNNINIESIRGDIAKLNESNALKANSNEVFEMKENIGIFFKINFRSIFCTGYFYKR